MLEESLFRLEDKRNSRTVGLGVYGVRVVDVPGLIDNEIPLVYAGGSISGSPAS